ncbi:cardiac-enriched FHL2-interacting protein [Clinocottus analis]|uniref:cardiac-enriched FHL2-interacting protein n=1 Tax=Clinocottus analis TaxID=304258 RepID=UPI0035C0A35C
MTSAEKRRSGRRSGGHRKHSDGGYSDTSSGGSYLDETDREVSNLTDRAFRSLCIGDEAVYNDSDLCSSSPCTQRDRQLAFSQSDQDRDGEDKEREEHESFGLRMQQYGRDWIHGGIYEAEIQRDPQWEVYGERTQGRVSATFQHSFVETSQREESLGEEQSSSLSNGTTELSTQQRRSRSRVSSLIRAFNSEGLRDGAGMDGKVREWNDEASWDKSALMSIQQELSEFSTPYQRNFTSGHFPSAGPFSSPDTNFYSSDVAGVAHMNSASSFMRSSHGKHSMSEQFNGNSNFFIHSEFSPFKVWRNHNRFPFQQAEVSGFMHCSEFPKWYETPIYRELSLDAQPQGLYRFDERGVRHPRNTLAPVVPPTLPRATSTSTILQKAPAVEKRCESELTGHYPNRTWMQSLGTKGFPLQRPSTASPTSEMSRRVQDTISSVKALQQKIKMMTEQNIATGITENQQGVLSSNTNLNPFSNNAKIVASNAASSNTSTIPFKVSQLLTPLVYAQQEEETPEVRQSEISPQPIEHPPVRAESRGATPDVRMSSYKSRATSLLFNLKDNRKRVKSTYSPTKFKGLETQEINKQYSTQAPRDTVIDIPDFPDPDSQLLCVEESSRTNAASNQYANLYNNPGLVITANSQPAHTSLYSEYTSSDYQRAQMPRKIVQHSGFTGFIPENDASYQPTNGPNLHEDLSSSTSYKQGMVNNLETLGGETSRFKPSYTATEIPRLDADNNQPREHFGSKANAEQHFNETVGRDFTQVDRYQQFKENKHDYSNVSSHDSWRQTNSQGTENPSLKAISPWKQEITALMEKDQHAQAYQRTDAKKEEANSLSKRYRGENQQSINKELEKIEFKESFGVGKKELVNTYVSNQVPQEAPFSNDTIEKTVYYGQQQPETLNNKDILQKYDRNTMEDEIKDNYLTQRYNKNTDQEYRNQHTLDSNKQETGQRKQYMPIPKVYETQSLQPIESKPKLEHNMQNKLLSNPDNALAPTTTNQVKDRQFIEVRTEQAMAEHTKAQHNQAELAKAQHWAQVEQPKAESARLILAGQTGSVKVKADQAKAELTEPEKVHQAEAEHIEEEKRKKKRTEQSREKQPERVGEEWEEKDQTRVEKVTEEHRNIKEEVGNEHLREHRGGQVKVKRAEAEGLKEEHMKAELAKTEQAAQARLEEVKLEQIHEQQAKAEQDKTMVENGNANTILVEDLKKKAEEQVQVSQLNGHQPTTQIIKAKERKTEQAKLEQNKGELTKTKGMQEKFAEPAAKLTVIQQIKTEPNQVEQVKTELAKAKAELTKIKEKMGGEQKEKVRNTVHKKEDEIKTDIPLNINKNEENKDQDQATQMNQQREDIVVISGQYLDQANRGSDEYECLREKYGFIDTTSANRNKVSAAGNVSSNDANETQAVSLDKVEITNSEKSKDNPSPTSKVETANTENKEGGSFKPPELSESQYVYSESSKEFKLSAENSLPKNVDTRANRDIVRDKVKDDSVEKLERCDSLKLTDISHNRDSESAIPPLPGRNLKSTEHSAGPGKDQHYTPPRALSSKERAQAKQEILTSKIKAHAEKEISAMKEKGFAVRDGFISKNSSKQLAGIQSNNIRQRPPSQEVPKKHESTMPSNMAPKHQMEPSGLRLERVKSVLPPSSAIIPVRSAATTSQPVDQLLKPVAKEPMKSNDNVPEPLGEEKTMGSISTDEGLVENRKKENPSEIKSTIQKKEQSPKKNEGKQEANPGEIFVKQKEGLEDNPVVNTDQFSKKKQDPLPAIDLVEAESSERMAIERAESKYKAVHEDSASALHLVLGQNKSPVGDDSLQITGIMVTVRERKLSTDNGQRKNSTQEQINVNEFSNSEQDQCHPSSGLEVSKGNTYSKEVSIVQKTHPTVKEDPTRVDMNNHPENMQENPTIETRQNNVSENVTVKRTNHQLESSSINTRPQLHEPFVEKHVPSSVAVSTENKDLAETQLNLYKQDILASETKDCSNEMSKENSTKSLWKDNVKVNTEEKNLQTAHTNDNLMAKVMNTAIKSTKTNRADAETLIKHDVQPSVEEDMTTFINPSKRQNIDGKNAPQVQEKGCESTTPKPFNKTSPSNHSTEKENTQVFPKHLGIETHIGENNQMDDTVHIGSIAIRVVPAVTEKENLKMVEKHHVPLVPCDVVAADEEKQVASSGVEENMNSLNNEDRTKALMSASSENQIKHDSGDTSGVQCVLSSVQNISDLHKNPQNNINANSEITQAEDTMPENVNSNRKSVNESKIRPMVGDYFQVQGEAERNNEPQNRTNVGDMSEVVSKGNELPELPLNEAAISNELCSQRNNEDFMLDQSKRKTVESSSVKKNRETHGNPASKQSYSPTERHGNTNEKTDAGQANHIRKRLTENQSSLPARERQSTRNLNATKENIVKEKLTVKPIPKERVATIPEISALADYARLKVIVSEEEANRIEEFPPNKKEGFFPLIQSRHSRRPVFTVEPQDVFMKNKHLPNKTEVSPKVNKEPKPLAFPITEKEHQRTGMFKLADKDRQEKMLLDVKANEGVVDTRAKHTQHLKERNSPPTTPLKNQGSEEQVSGTDAQRVHVSQNLKLLDNATPHEKAVGQVYKIEGVTATLRKDERTSAVVKAGEGRTEKIRQERLATQHEETKGPQQRIEKLFEERQLSKIEEEKKAEEIRVKHLMEENRASLAEEERRAAQREEERRARERETIAMKIKERREKQREAERKAEEKQAAQKEIEEKRRIKIEEGRREKLREEEERIKENERRRRVKQQQEEKAAQEEQQRRADEEERQRRDDQKMQQRRDDQEEQQRRADQEEQQRRADQKEQQRRADQKEQQRRADQEEQQQRRAAQEEQQRRADQKEQQRRADQKEQQRRADQEEQQQRRAAQEEQQRRADQEEQQRRADQEEQHQRRAAQEEQQRRADQEEQQQRRAAQEEQKRRADQEEQQQRRAAQEEQQRRADQEEQQRRADQEEQQRRADQEEQQRRAAQEEQQQRRADQEEQQRRAALIEEQMRAKQIEEKKLTDIEEENKRKQREEGKEEKAAHISEEERIKHEQKIEEQRGERHSKKKGLRTQTEKDESKAVEPEKTFVKEREENQTKGQRNRRLEKSQAALKEEEMRVKHEWMLNQREDEIRAKKREEEKEKKLANHMEKDKETRVGEQKKAAQRIDALQYYAITSTDTERKPRERPLCSPLPSQQRHNPSGLGSSEESGSHARPYRPHAPASPAPSLPRSDTSSPALGGKPLMFRVKDNTMRGSSFKSVKPRFHKNFEEDFRVGSPMERASGREEDEQEIMRRSAGTPVYPDTGLNRLAAIKESSTFQSAYLSQDYSALLPQHKPYSRRSFALEEDDSRSVISNMSEGGESFATSAADLADIRGLYDYERPESACSFSSDVSRSLGKPPTVPPKSEKALRRAQRLTTRRIKKELSKIASDIHAGAEKSLQDTSSIPSSSTEKRSSSRQTVASPHFSSPVSLAHAPTLGSSFPSSHTDHQFSHSSFYASPHATGPISLPVASPHATDPASLPDASPKVTGPASQTAAPGTVAHVPSSPTLLHANHQAPVTQYHVESSYPHSYPLTQRKVLQDLGSGQYFVVDVPVQVKTKTFFDPETGKYVQLNVRQSGQSTALPQPQQTYSQPQLQPQMQVKLQQQPRASPAGKPFVLYQGNHSYPQDYQPQTITSVPGLRSSAPLTLPQEQQPAWESYGYPAHEMEQKSEGHCYSPEKSPYMDTVNDKDKTYSTVYNTHGPNEWFPESDTNSQLAGSSVCENDNSAHSQCQPRDIITMSELDDFMELSDW